MPQASKEVLTLVSPAAPARTLGSLPKAPEVAVKPQQLPSQAAASGSATQDADQSAASGKSSAGAIQEQKANTARPLEAAAAVKRAAPPASAATQNGSAVRLGRVEVPSNIPNLGGRRPKQAQAVQDSALCTARFNHKLCLYLGKSVLTHTAILLLWGCAGRGRLSTKTGRRVSIAAQSSQSSHFASVPDWQCMRRLQ